MNVVKLLIAKLSLLISLHHSAVTNSPQSLRCDYKSDNILYEKVISKNNHKILGMEILRTNVLIK